MIYPPLDGLLKVVDSRYALVIAASKRARQILDDDRRSEVENTEKSVSRALKEIYCGKTQAEIPPVVNK